MLNYLSLPQRTKGQHHHNEYPALNAICMHKPKSYCLLSSISSLVPITYHTKDTWKRTAVCLEQPFPSAQSPHRVEVVLGHFRPGSSLSSLTKSFAWTKSLSCSQSSPNLTITMQSSGEKSIKYAFLLTQKTACPSHNAEERTQVTKQFANVVIYYTDKLWAGREKVQL